MHCSNVEGAGSNRALVDVWVEGASEELSVIDSFRAFQPCRAASK